MEPLTSVTLGPVWVDIAIAAWRNNPIVPTLGLEPNGALAFSSDDQGYFERDSLAALSILLTRLSTLQALDDTITELRDRNPHPQRLITVAHSLDHVLGRLEVVLPTWRISTTEDGVVSFDGSTHEHLAVRASGTEVGTRLYLEGTTSHGGPHHQPVQHLGVRARNGIIKAQLSTSVLVMTLAATPEK